MAHFDIWKKSDHIELATVEFAPAELEPGGSLQLNFELNIKAAPEYYSLYFQVEDVLIPHVIVFKPERGGIVQFCYTIPIPSTLQPQIEPQPLSITLYFAKGKLPVDAPSEAKPSTENQDKAKELQEGKSEHIVTLKGPKLRRPIYSPRGS